MSEEKNKNNEIGEMSQVIKKNYDPREKKREGS